MWYFGALLYQLCTKDGQTLWKSNQADNIEEDEHWIAQVELRKHAKKTAEVTASRLRWWATRCNARGLAPFPLTVDKLKLAASVPVRELISPAISEVPVNPGSDTLTTSPDAMATLLVNTTVTSVAVPAVAGEYPSCVLYLLPGE